ncbi:carboxylesterase family protein [Agrobacterium cavarae]
MTDIEIFRNIRYAHSLRFEQPELIPWDGVRLTERGPVCPQLPSRLELVQGPMPEMEMSEHCQVLSVFSPALSGKRPVMVFFHGGGFVTGGGELSWHDGDKLASEQDLVVVSVTYRLGVFGYFQQPGGSDPSPAMADQVAALRWVKANIGLFGGDPDNITVFGQSAGGFSIATMLAWGHGGELFKRAILQSGAYGLAHTRAEADTTSDMFLDELGGDPRSATIDELIAAQDRLAAKLKRLALWSAVLPPADSGLGVDVIAGWCRDDALPFVLLQKQVKPSPGTETRFLDETREMNELFEGGSRSLVRDMAEKGHRALLYRFDWESPGTGLGACHCIELPFLLGSEQAWRSAPAVAGSDWSKIEPIGRHLRKLWADFARGDYADADWSPGTVRILP